MYHLTIYFPLLLYIYQRFSINNYANKYTTRCFEKIKSDNSLELLMTLMVIHIAGFEYISHYRQAFAQCQSSMSKIVDLCCYGRLQLILGSVSTGMPTWKIFLLQRRLIKEYAPNLCEDGFYNTLYLDWAVMHCFSRKREGSQVGENKRYKGKPCYQCLFSYIGKIFIDCKLCSGATNPKIYFQKMVKRANGMGYMFQAVVADAAFGNIKNVLFLHKLSLHYALGASSSMNIIAKAKNKFKQLNHQGSGKIQRLKKGLYVFDAGKHWIKNDIYTRVVVFRRIHRRKKKGKWKVKSYYYAIITDLDWTLHRIHKYYHTRQVIESGIKELKYHYYLNRTTNNSLKANEFFIASKILASTMVKMFQNEFLPKHLQSLRRKTLIRCVFASSIARVVSLKYEQTPIEIDTIPRAKYSWHWRRIVSKIVKDQSLLNNSKSVA